MLSIVYFLEIWLSVVLLMAAGYCLASLLLLLLARVRGTVVRASLLTRLTVSYLLAILFVSLPSFLFRAGLGGIDLFPLFLSLSLVLLGVAGGALFLRDVGRRYSLRSLRPSDLLFITFSVSAIAVVSYVFSVHSVDTNYDFYFANYKVIGWALHDGSLSNPLLQYAYDLRMFPAYWLYSCLDAVLGPGVTMFSLSIAGLLSLALLVYKFAREEIGQQVARAAAVMLLVSPLTLLYSFRGLDLDLTTYYVVFASFTFLYIALKRGRGGDRHLWLILAGLGASAALFCDPKGFIVALLLPSLVAIYSTSKAAKAVWALAFFGVLCYAVLGPLLSHGPLQIAYVAALLPPILVLYTALHMVTFHQPLDVAAVSPSRGLTSRDLGLLLLASSPGLAWQALFGYLPILLASGSLAPLSGALSSALGQSVPFSASSYASSVAGNLPNLVSSFLGLFSFPYFAAPLTVIGVVGVLYLVYRRERQLQPLFAYAVIVVSSILGFAQGSAAVDNWRYFYLLMPFSAIAAAWGISVATKGRFVVPAAIAFASSYLFTIPLSAVAFTGASVYFSNAARGVVSWTDPSLWWLAGAVALLALYVPARLGWWGSLDAKLRASRTRSLAITLVAVVSVALILQPFAAIVGTTAFQDVSTVKQDKGFEWNGDLQAPFAYISENKARFSGSAFLSLYAYGIEYYAGVPSLDLSQFYQVAEILPHINDSSALRSFLVGHNIRYALLPTPSNTVEGYGASALSLERASALGEMLNGSALMKNWGDWALYNLTAP